MAGDLYQKLTTIKELTNMARVYAACNDIGTVQDYGKLMFVGEEHYRDNKFPERIWGNIAIWPDYLLPIKHHLEGLTDRVYGNCICIYYPDGNSGVDFHSDYQAFGDTSVIPSLSLGEERVFQLREKSTYKINSTKLENGSLIIMGEHCQERYEYSVPLDPTYTSPRINLTFRQVD